MRDDTKLNYLWEWVNEIKKKIADNTAYTLPAYSSTDEVNTGQKWIDGKDIYCKVLSFTTNSISTPLIIGAVSVDILIETNTIVTAFGNQINSFNCYSYYDPNGYMYNIASSEGSQSKPAICIIRYTKPDPAPLNTSREDPEPLEEKKTRTRKTTKKEEE